MHVDAGQIGRGCPHDGVQIFGGRWSRPIGVIPAVTPYRPAGMGGDVVGQQSQQVPGTGGRAEVETGE